MASLVAKFGAKFQVVHHLEKKMSLKLRLNSFQAISSRSNWFSVVSDDPQRVLPSAETTASQNRHFSHSKEAVILLSWNEVSWILSVVQIMNFD